MKPFLPKLKNIENTVTHCFRILFYGVFSTLTYTFWWTMPNEIGFKCLKKVSQIVIFTLMSGNLISFEAVLPE